MASPAFRMPSLEFRLPSCNCRLPRPGFRMSSLEFNLPRSDFRIPNTFPTEVSIDSPKAYGDHPRTLSGEPACC